MKIVDALIMARNLIADPAHWSQGVMEETLVDGTRCYCSLGAIRAAITYMGPTKNRSTKSLKARRYLSEAIVQYSGSNDNDDSVISFNDYIATTHAMVLSVFDLAIKNAKRRHVRGDRQKKTTNYCLKPKATETV